MNSRAFGLLSLSVALASPAFGQGLCSPQETVYLNCQTKKGKTLSVCGSRDLSSDTGYLQYRYGRLNSLELAFPENTVASQSKFKWRTDPHAGVVAHWLIFYRSNYQYTVFSIEGSNTPKGRVERRYGVITTDPKGNESSIDCASVTAAKLEKLANFLPLASDSE